MFQVGKPTGLLTGLGYVTEKHTLGYTLSTVKMPNINTVRATCSGEGIFQNRT